MDPPPAKKSRKAIKVSQRKALRAWYNDDSNGKQSLRSAGQWWLRTYGYVLNSSTCGEILSQKWAYLDDTSISTGQDSSKGRECQWKELEEALFEWEQRYEAENNPLTGAILREKAQEFWRKLPCYQGLPAPKLSDGWLTRFKHRHNIRRRIKHGEAGSADHSDQIAEIMADIRDVSTSAESDEEIEAISKVSIQEALSALQTLKLYEEQQESGDPALTKALRRRERELHLSRSTALHQGKLDSWFGNT